MLALGCTARGTVFEMWLWLRDPWHRDAYGQFDPLRVGLHIPNCELFVGRSSYEELVGRPRVRRSPPFRAAAFRRACGGVSFWWFRPVSPRF